MTTYKPTWADHEKDLHSADAKTQERAADAFITQREKEMAISQKARDWEEGRRKEVAKMKPEWVKKRREEALNEDPSRKLLQDIKTGGAHEEGLAPARGYILIEPIIEQTVSGSILIAEGAVEPNTAWVLAVGGDLVLDKNVLPRPVEGGEKILFKKFAGMNITVKGKNCRIIQFTDVLGTLTNE